MKRLLADPRGAEGDGGARPEPGGARRRRAHRAADLRGGRASARMIPWLVLLQTTLTIATAGPATAPEYLAALGGASRGLLRAGAARPSLVTPRAPRAPAAEALARGRVNLAATSLEAALASARPRRTSQDRLRAHRDAAGGIARADRPEGCYPQHRGPFRVDDRRPGARHARPSSCCSPCWMWPRSPCRSSR